MHRVCAIARAGAVLPLLTAEGQPSYVRPGNRLEFSIIGAGATRQSSGCSEAAVFDYIGKAAAIEDRALSGYQPAAP